MAMFGHLLHVCEAKLKRKPPQNSLEPVVDGRCGDHLQQGLPGPQNKQELAQQEAQLDEMLVQRVVGVGKSQAQSVADQQEDDPCDGQTKKRPSFWTRLSCFN